MRTRTRFFFITMVASIFDTCGTPMSRRLKDFLSHIARRQTQAAGQRYSCDVDALNHNLLCSPIKPLDVFQNITLDEFIYKFKYRHELVLVSNH